MASPSLTSPIRKQRQSLAGTAGKAKKPGLKKRDKFLFDIHQSVGSTFYSVAEYDKSVHSYTKVE